MICTCIYFDIEAILCTKYSSGTTFLIDIIWPTRIDISDLLSYLIGMHAYETQSVQKTLIFMVLTVAVPIFIL